MNKRKVAGTIIGIMLFLLFIIGLTFAFYKWRSPDKDNVIVGFTIDDLGGNIIYYNGEGVGDISRKVITGTLTKENNYMINTTIALYKKNVSNTLYGHIYLNVSSIDEKLAREKALKWAIYEGDKVEGQPINEGNFNGEDIGNNIPLDINVELDNKETKYTICIYLDVDEVADTNIIDSKITTEIMAEVSTPSEGIDDGLYESLYINSLSNDNYKIKAYARDFKYDIISYAITTKQEEPNNWENFNATGKEQNIEETVDSDGTYYIWVKNSENKTTYKSITIDSSSSSFNESNIVITLGNMDKIYFNKDSKITIPININSVNEIEEGILKSDNIIVKVGNNIINNKKLEYDKNNKYYVLILENLTKEGNLTIEIPKGTIKDNKGSSNNKTNFNVGVVDNTRPNCSFKDMDEVIEKNVNYNLELTCTDSRSGLIWSGIDKDRLTSKNNDLKIVSVGLPTAVTGGYKYIVTVNANKVNSYGFVLTLKEDSISDRSGNYNDEANIVLKGPEGSIYTVMFTMGEGVESIGSSSLNCVSENNDSCTVTLPSITPIEGYEALGWQLEGSDDYLSPGTKISINSDTVTYVAKAEPSIYNIKLDNQGASTFGTENIYYKYNTSKTVDGSECYYYSDNNLSNCLSKISIPSKTGYKFSGYYTEENGEGVSYIDSNGNFTNDLYKEIGDRTLYAKWVPIEYTIVFNGNGNTDGTMESLTCTYDVSCTLPDNKFTKTGYGFSGWALSETGKVAYNNKASVRNLSDKDGSTVNLYVNWTINTVTIYYSVNGGNITSPTNNNQYYWKTATYDAIDGVIQNSTSNDGTYDYIKSTITYKGTLPSTGLNDWNNSGFINIARTGYIALSGKEWKCLKGCTTEGATFNQVTAYESSSFCNVEEDNCEVILGVNWQGNGYIVEYNNTCPLSASGTMSNTTHIYGTPSNLRSNTYGCTAIINYDYAGATGGTSPTTSTYAMAFGGWTYESRTFSDNQEVTDVIASGTATLSTKWNNGTAVTLPTPTKTGYNFEGWYNGNTKVGTGGATWRPTTATVTLTAHWTRNFKCAVAGSNTSYAGKTWYTISNANNVCDLALNAVSSTTGSYNNYATNLKNEYFASGTLKSELDAGLITSYDTSSNTNAGISSGVFWIGSGALYDTSARTRYSYTSNCLYRNMHNVGADGDLECSYENTGTSSTALAAGKKTNGGSYVVNNASSTYSVVNGSRSSTSIGNYSRRMTSFWFIYNSPADTSSTNLNYKFTVYTELDEYDEYNNRDGNGLTIVCCGHAYQGVKVVFTPVSSTKFHYKNGYSGTSKNYSYTNDLAYMKVFDFAGSASRTGSESAGWTYDYSTSSSSGNCHSYNQYTLSNYAISVKYRLHIKVKTN